MKTSVSDNINLKTRIEHISFENGYEYMDIESRIGYIDISIGGIENSKFAVTLEEWKHINKTVLQLFKQIK